MIARKYENISIDLQDKVVTLSIDRPKALNALNSATMEELADFFTKAVYEFDQLSGIIITGSGDRAFVAGADINDFLGLDAKNIEGFVRRGHDIFNAIERFHKPVIAAIRGFALGGGCELAMACHLRVATHTSKFGQPEVNLGIIPGYGGTQRLVQLIGKSKAMELMLTAELIDADKAHELGLVNKLVDDGEEINAARALIEKIALKAPLAVTAIIESVNAYFDNTRDGFENEIMAFSKLALTEDFKEGASAFIQKRNPFFKSS